MEAVQEGVVLQGGALVHASPDATCRLHEVSKRTAQKERGKTKVRTNFVGLLIDDDVETVGDSVRGARNPSQSSADDSDPAVQFLWQLRGRRHELQE